MVSSASFDNNFSAEASVIAGLRTAVFKPAYELYTHSGYQPGTFLSALAIGQMPSTAFGAGPMGSGLLPSYEQRWIRGGLGMNVNKGDPPGDRDNPDGPENPGGHHDPGNSSGPSGNEGGGAPQPPDGGGNGGGRGGGSLNSRVPGGPGGPPGPLGGNSWGGGLGVQPGAVPPARLP